MTVESKLVLFRAEAHADCECESCCLEASLSTTAKEIEIAELAKYPDLKASLLRALIKLVEEGDADIVNNLRNVGIVRIADIEKRETVLEAEKRFWLCAPKGVSNASFWYITSTHPREIRLETLSENDIRAMAAGVEVLQSVSKVSIKNLLSEKQRKVYDAEVRRINNEKKTKAAATKAAAAKKKAAQIAKAKKLLQDAGENV